MKMINEIKIPPFSSGGIILSYQCTNECRHCLYACSPTYRDWMSSEDLDQILRQIKNHNEFLTGIHFAGGEPFLNPDLLVEAIQKAADLGLPIDYVETNGFWCREKEKGVALMQQLKAAGLRALLISCSPFHQEYLPYKNVANTVNWGREVFGRSNILIYTQYFYQQLNAVKDETPLMLDSYIDILGKEEASMIFANEYGLIPNGRAATQLSFLYEHRSASAFFGETCRKEIISPHHIHIDCYGNYIAGLCAGITLGDSRNLDSLYQGIQLEDKPLLRHLTTGGVEALYNWVIEQYDYEERHEGYIAKCHLCLDIRTQLINKGVNLKELAPVEFYKNL